MSRRADNDPSLQVVAEPQSPRSKRRASGDGAALDEAEACWAALASGIARSNPRRPLAEVEIGARQALQTLVFLKMCLERGLLPHSAFHPMTEDPTPEGRLDRLLRSAEARLGPGLFRVKRRGNRRCAKEADPATLRIDNQTLLAAVSRLSTLGSPLARAGRRVELLGLIHEHLVGRTLRRDRTGQLGVERNPKVKKEGGVFYTPDYVTQYIVRNSLGLRLATLGPDMRRRRGLKILDPACGCGAFLLAACRHLLRWCSEHDVPDAVRLVAASVHGVDLDPEAILATRRSLWLEMTADRSACNNGNGSRRGHKARNLVDYLAENVRCGDVLTGPVPGQPAAHFDTVIGNPPYRRELNSKHFLDPIAQSDFGRRYRAPRMDLWYYFLHRSLEWLKPGGGLAFIVGSYWTSARGAEKLLGALRESAHVEEIFLLDRLRVFPGVAGRHMILRLTKGTSGKPTTIRRAAATAQGNAEPYFRGTAPLIVFQKTAEQLFRSGHIDVEPPCDELLAKLARWTALGALGRVRQGIVENPAAVTQKTNESHGNCWRPGEGVFALRPDELAGLSLPVPERRLVRPYYDLCDLGRYFLAEEPSLALIYATAETCPDIDAYPVLRTHLARFRPIMEARRETQRGVRPWWHLHWPREEQLWRSPKIISLQMARRPAFVPATSPVYVPFSTNVFVPHPHTREHLRYVTALLNSRLMWKWYRHHAKRRGVGLEINGHVLARTPIRTIDFSKPTERASHDRLVTLVERILRLNRRLHEVRAAEKTPIDQRIGQIDRQIDAIVYELYGTTESEIAIPEAPAGL